MIAVGYRVGEKPQLNPADGSEAIGPVGDRTVEAVVLDRRTPTGR